MLSRLLGLACALLLLGAPAVATATEPPCAYPTCFPMGDAQVARVFSANDTRLEVVSVGSISNVTMVLYRLITPNQKKPSWREGYLVSSKDSKGFQVSPLVAQKAPDPTLQFTGELANTTNVVVGGIGVTAATTLQLDARASKIFRGSQAVKAYRQQSTLAGFNQNVAEAQILLDAELSKLPKTCGADITGTVDGSKLSAAQLIKFEDMGVSGFEHRCLDSVAAIEALCQRHPDAPAKLTGAVKNLRCIFVAGDKSSAALDRKSQTLVVEMSLTQARDGRTSFNWLRFLEATFK